VQRFTNRQVATTRIWKALQRLELGGGEVRPVAAKRPSVVGRKAPPAARKERGNSRTTRVIALLRRPQGATLQAIMKATGWQTHSVRRFINGQLKTKLGLKVRSAKREGKRVYIHQTLNKNNGSDVRTTFPRTTRGRRPVWLESLLPSVRRSFVRR
jgi:hypothetical protein